MPRMIFVNLPVTNVPVSMTFYEALGFTNNPQFTTGTADINPMQDLGFMYNRPLADPDGHIWEAFWMDPAAMQQDAPGA